MVRSNRSKRVQINKPPPQDGGSPAYRYHGQLGLLSGSSLDHSPVPLTVHENGHSDHIVHTSGGGRCGSMKKSRRKGRGKSRRSRGKSRRGRGATVILSRLARRQKVKTMRKPVRKSSSSSSVTMLRKQRVNDTLPPNLNTREVNRLAPKKPYKYSFERK